MGRRPVQEKRERLANSMHPSRSWPWQASPASVIAALPKDLKPPKIEQPWRVSCQNSHLETHITLRHARRTPKHDIDLP